MIKRQYSQDDGAAMISVVWVVFLLGLMATAVLALTLRARQAVQVTEEDARAKYLAASAVDVFIYRYFYDAEQQVHRSALFKLLDHDVEVTVGFEKGLININEADSRILAAMFAARGVSESEALALGDAIVDWRDPDNDPLDNGAERPSYDAVAVPRNGPFESLGELQYVSGMTPDRYFCVLDQLTIHTLKSATTDLYYATDAVRESYQWAFDNGWGHDNPEDYPSKIESPEGGDAVEANAIRLHISIDGELSGDYETVIRFLAKGGSDSEYRTLVPIRRISVRPPGAIPVCA